jgi:hypothetical protein
VRRKSKRGKREKRKEAQGSVEERKFEGRKCAPGTEKVMMKRMISEGRLEDNEISE